MLMLMIINDQLISQILRQNCIERIFTNCTYRYWTYCKMYMIYLYSF